MHDVANLEGRSSPLVGAVTHTRFATGGSVQMRPDGCRDGVIFRIADTTTVLRT